MEWLDLPNTLVSLLCATGIFVVLVYNRLSVASTLVLKIAKDAMD